MPDPINESPVEQILTETPVTEPEQPVDPDPIPEPAKEAEPQEQEKVPDLPEPAPEPAKEAEPQEHTEVPAAEPPKAPDPVPEPPTATELNVEESKVTESKEPPITTESKVEELKVESMPEPEPTPAPPLIKDEPKPEAPIATESKVTELKVESLAEEKPAVHDPKYTKGIPQKVLELTAEEINAARLLWGREQIAEAQAQGNLNRKARMNSRMDAIVKIVKAGPETTTHTVAKSMSLSEKSTSSYLQKLVHAGRIKATGNSSNRRYSA